MQFSWSDWILRKKISAQLRDQPGRMEHRRVVNPYHCVSIRFSSNCCQQVRAIDGQRFLAGSAPQLPLPGCEAASCDCRYVHYDDRRAEDRRAQVRDRKAYRLQDRRAGSGRRVND